MARENLSQRVLLEVLTKEIEVLKAATKQVNRTLPKFEGYINDMDGKISQIKGSKVSIDTSELEKAFKGKMTAPKWLIWAFLTSFVLAVGAGVFAFYQHKDKQAWEQEATYWHQVAVEHGYNPDK